MIKATLEFDTCSGNESLLDAINGFKWKMVVNDMDEYLRGQLKHNGNLSKGSYQALETVREQLHELIADSELSLG